MKKFLILFLLVSMQLVGYAQEAVIPRIIAFPSRLYMNQRNFGQTVEVNGRERFLPDYDKAFLNDPYLKTALSSVSNSLHEKGFEVEMLESSLEDIGDLDAINLANDGQMTIDDKIMDGVRPDIKLEVEFYISSQLGPRKGWTIKISAVDAYTNEPVGEASAVVDPSSNVPDLVLKQFMNANVDIFAEKLMNYFRDLRERGRKVNVIFYTTQDSDINLEEDEYDENPINEYFEDWLKKYAYKKSCRTTRCTAHSMSCIVRIPFFDEEGIALETKQWVRPLRNEIKNLPMGYKAIIKTHGLGRVAIELSNK